jgi:SAM-dependent methyltransferase
MAANASVSTENVSTFASQRWLKGWLKPLRNTPLHPQWLVFLKERAALKEVGALLSGSVLDVGCANRRLRPFLSQHIHYIGLDYPLTANSMYHTSPDVFGDAQALPIATNSLDGVALLDVLEHLPDPTIALIEIARALKPGGLFVLQVPFIYPVHDAPFDFQRWTCFGLNRLLSQHLFAVEKQVAFGHPLETAAVNGNIALARTTLDLLERRNPLFLVFLLLLPFVIPLKNISAWLFSHVAGHDEMMPMGYRFVCRKQEPNDE